MNHVSRTSHRKKGAIGEETAAAFLRNNGYTIIEMNYYYQHGEIDIIAKENDVLVFVEVKSRSSSRYGAPEESVTPKKQEILRRTAEGYMIERNLTDIVCRFDVVSISSDNGAEHCTVFKDCF